MFSIANTMSLFRRGVDSLTGAKIEIFDQYLDLGSNRTEQNLIARVCKSEAEVTDNKGLHLRYCTVVNLTTERHEASRSLSATAKLLADSADKLAVVIAYR